MAPALEFRDGRLDWLWVSLRHDALHLVLGGLRLGWHFSGIGLYHALTVSAEGMINDWWVWIVDRDCILS